MTTARDNQRHVTSDQPTSTRPTSTRQRETSSRSLRRHPRTVVLSALAAAGAAGLLAACSSGSGSASAGGSGAAGGGGTSTLAAHQLSGVGTVLVDQAGKTVYTPDQETSTMIKCTGSCLSFWTPVTASSGSASTAPQGFSGVIGTVKRPDDGTMQVTYNGKPLYTFRLDAGPGQAKGNNFQDNFNGTSFTWRAVSTTGTSGGGPAPSPSGSGGYGGTGGYGGSGGGGGTGGY